MYWCEEPTHWKRPWCWERLKVGGEGDDRGWDGWMASLTHWNMSLSKFSEIVKDREVWRAAVHGVPKSRTQLRDWTELIYVSFYLSKINTHSWLNKWLPTCLDHRLYCAWVGGSTKQSISPAVPTPVYQQEMSYAGLIFHYSLELNWGLNKWL